MHLHEVVKYLDDLLRTREVGDFPQAMNGLQFENSGSISRIGAAVDATEAVIREALEAQVDFLIVHHGLFWNGPQRVTDATYRKTRLLMDADMAIYSAHLPLDIHPQIGNNALLASAIGFKNGEPFFETSGQPVGLRFEEEINREVLRDHLERAVGGPVHMAPGGPVLARKIGIVTGGAGGDIAKAAAAGIDTFITGEGPHWSYTAAEELRVNLFYAGHYATETFGVKALADLLSKKTALPWQFIDHPTGLSIFKQRALIEVEEWPASAPEVGILPFGNSFSVQRTPGMGMCRGSASMQHCADGFPNETARDLRWH